MGESKAECRQNVMSTVNFSNNVGFIVHPTKSIFEPTQILEYLGFILNSILMRISVNERQATKIASACKDLIKNTEIKVIDLARVVGLLVASFPGVQYGRLYYRHLDNVKTSALKKGKGDYNAPVHLDGMCRDDLEWWINNIHHTHNPISHGNPSLMIRSDASETGWGAACGGATTGGNWSNEEALNHINYLELLAAWFALRCFAKELSNIHIKLEIDNTTALAYVGNMGGRLFQMNTLAREIWIWCKSRNIYLSVAYIASEDNTDAEIDLFASRLNKQLDCYVSWKPDPFAWTVDAFTFDWSKFFVYAFPPFTLIGRILQKIELDMVEQAIVIVPFWTTQPWFSKLGKMLINCPFLLPRRINTLLHLTKAKHELNKLQLIACNLSGNTTRCQTLIHMDIRNIDINKSRICVTFGDLLKQSRPGCYLQQLTVKGYPPDRRLCLTTVLMEYMARVEDIRGHETRLFLTTKKPFKAASRSPDGLSRRLPQRV